MDNDSATGATLLLTLLLGAWLWHRMGGYTMKVCPTCNGDGREFQRKGSSNFRVCTRCGGNKSIPR